MAKTNQQGTSTHNYWQKKRALVISFALIALIALTAAILIALPLLAPAIAPALLMALHLALASLMPGWAIITMAAMAAATSIVFYGASIGISFSKKPNISDELGLTGWRAATSEHWSKITATEELSLKADVSTEIVAQQLTNLRAKSLLPQATPPANSPPARRVMSPSFWGRPLPVAQEVAHKPKSHTPLSQNKQGRNL